MTAICENVGLFIVLLSVRFHILSMFVSGRTALIIAVAFVGLVSVIYSEAA